MPEVAGAASESTHVLIRSVSSTMDSAYQRITFDVVRVGDMRLKLAGRTLTVRDARGRSRTAVFDADSDGTRSATIAAYSSIYYAEDDDTGWGPNPDELWLPPRFLPMEGGTLSVDEMDDWSFGPLPLDGGELRRDGTIVSPPEAVIKTTALVVREYYHAGMEHYLLTANAVEFDALDSGTVPGWKPTGKAFFAYQGKPAESGFVPVCRFLLLYPSGYSHFLSSFVDECAGLEASEAAILETRAAFYMAASEGTSCPDARIVYANGSESIGSTGVPIYRLWNGKAEANHRYVFDRAERDAMVARGWVSEGAGSEGVAMCGYSADGVFN
jgi:hypothetical protein